MSTRVFTEDALFPLSIESRTAQRPVPAFARKDVKVAQNRKLSRQLRAALSEPSNVLFLDIETTGLSRYYDEVTLVGWLRDGVYRVHIAGDDTGQLFSAIEGASAIVTF